MCLFFGRLWCPQHNLQCVSCSVTQLQQPIWWWIWHWVQTETLHSLHLLFFGSIILEKVPIVQCTCTNIEGIERIFFLFICFGFIWVFSPFRQKVCCGIVYKGRFGEVIIDPRLFKPCCSSKKQTLGSTQVATRLPDTIPQQLQEDVKENWWLLLLNPLQGYLGIRLSLSPVADLHVSIPPMKSVWFFFLLLNVSFYVGIFLHFCIEQFFSFIKKKVKKRKKYYGH